jgi:Lrp/AsnC family transcriptional regulator, regulator for asnA, asnC and gidA
MSKPTGKLNLDKLDYQIIQAMMEDASMSYADLGKQLFVSGGTLARTRL